MPCSITNVEARATAIVGGVVTSAEITGTATGCSSVNVVYSGQTINAPVVSSVFAASLQQIRSSCNGTLKNVHVECATDPTCFFTGDIKVKCCKTRSDIETTVFYTDAGTTMYLTQAELQGDDCVPGGHKLTFRVDTLLDAGTTLDWEITMGRQPGDEADSFGTASASWNLTLPGDGIKRTVTVRIEEPNCPGFGISWTVSDCGPTAGPPTTNPCPKGFRWDSKLRKCVPDCPPGTSWNPIFNRCEKGNGKDNGKDRPPLNGESGWCGGIRIAAVIALGAAVFCTAYYLCVPPPANEPFKWAAAGFAAAAASLMLAYSLLKWCKKPCSWKSLVMWQASLAAALALLYFTNCCPTFYGVAAILGATTITFFEKWRRECHPSLCRIAGELLFVISTFVVPLLDKLRVLPGLDICLNPTVEISVGVAAGIIGVSAAACLTTHR